MDEIAHTFHLRLTPVPSLQTRISRLKRDVEIFLEGSLDLIQVLRKSQV